MNISDLIEFLQRLPNMPVMLFLPELYGEIQETELAFYTDGQYLIITALWETPRTGWSRMN